MLPDPGKVVVSFQISELNLANLEAVAKYMGISVDFLVDTLLSALRTPEQMAQIQREAAREESPRTTILQRCMARPRTSPEYQKSKQP